MGYWNDNFILKNILGKKVTQGKDDYVTASFWLQVAHERSPGKWFLDIYHNILTNKQCKYRTDLLTLRLSIERDTVMGPVRFGTGFIANGNYGGEELQNRYHKLRNIDQIHIPYAPKSRSGITFFGSYKPQLWNRKNIKLKGYLLHSYHAVVGPSNVKTGIDVHTITHYHGWVSFLNIQAQFGYVDYYHKSEYLSPLFRNGFSWGMLVSGGFSNIGSIAIWMIHNQYGMNQPHFGISFAFRGNRSSMSDLSDISFP